MASKAIILCGLPGTGKSTYARKLKAADPELHIVSTDDIIDEMAAESGASYSETFYTRLSEAKAKMISRLNDAMCEKRDLVWDQINIGRAKRAGILNLFENTGYRMHCVYFAVNDEAEWRRRIDSRGEERYVPETALEEMRKRLRTPLFDEGFHLVSELDMFGNKTGEQVNEEGIKAGNALPNKEKVIKDFLECLTDDYLTGILDEGGATNLVEILQHGVHVIQLRFKFWLEEENGVKWNEVEAKVADKLICVHTYRNSEYGQPT